MADPLQVYLFDLDGVLITAGGYNAALRATVDRFAEGMGIGESTLSESAIETFAVLGMGLEWDSSAICLGRLLFELWKADPALRLAGDFPAMALAIARRRPAHPAIDYRAWAERVARATPAQGHAPLAALQLLLDEVRLETDGFRLADITQALHLILGDTRDLSTSVTMSVVQHFTLGSSLYAQVYGRPADFETPSLLRRFDRPALIESDRRMVEVAVRQKRALAAVFTLRLSLPRELEVSGPEFAPEAEIALESAGMPWLPMVGYGQVRWLAAQHDAAPDSFVKPSPIHVLAALARAAGGGERESLEAAYDLWHSGRVGAPYDMLRERRLTLHVFEDTAGSVRGACEAAQCLHEHGIDVECRAYGIASSPEREAALRGMGIEVFAHLAPALRAAGLAPAGGL
jgi:hypothetical protein